MTRKTGIHKFVGDAAFYRKIMQITIPIIIQNGITNFVSLLDNIMVGQVGTEQMSGVSVANNLMFVYNICIFGAIAGAGILGAQYYGKGDQEGVRYTFRFKLICSLIISALAWLILGGFGTPLIRTYLHDTGEGGDVLTTLLYGEQYLQIMLLGMVPYALVQSYAGTLREGGETKVPMVAGLIAVTVNMVCNYILIFGHFGAPALGVRGAAIATVLSRFVELAIVVIWTHSHRDSHAFIKGVYRSLYIPKNLSLQIMKVGAPLLLNESLWSVGIAVIAQCYSVRGLQVVAANNIANTIGNLFNVVSLSMGSAVSIVIGQLLGAGQLEQAREEDNQIIAFALVCCVIVGALMYLVAPAFPGIYNTTEEIRQLSTSLIRISALCMPLYGFTNAAYFTLRSGGKTVVTFLFDSVFVWVCSIPVAFCLSRFTAMPIVPIYLTVQLLEIIKCGIGFVLVKKGVWIQNLVTA
jgi:putative MATE family efflux protein